jgi:hypothetical protein
LDIQISEGQRGPRISFQNFHCEIVTFPAFNGVGYNEDYGPTNSQFKFIDGEWNSTERQSHGTYKVVHSHPLNFELLEGTAIYGNRTDTGEFEIDQSNFQLSSSLRDGTRKYDGKSLEGTFSSHRIDGKKTNPNGTVEEGEFAPDNGHPLLKGTISYPNTERKKTVDLVMTPEGNFLGKITYLDGRKAEGRFKCEDDKHLLMEGKLTHPNGKQEKGIFTTDRTTGVITLNDGARQFPNDATEYRAE